MEIKNCKTGHVWTATSIEELLRAIALPIFRDTTHGQYQYCTLLDRFIYSPPTTDDLVLLLSYAFLKENSLSDVARANLRKMVEDFNASNAAKCRSEKKEKMGEEIMKIDRDLGGGLVALFVAAANVTLAPGGWIVGGRTDRPCDIEVHFRRADADATLADMVLEESTYDSSLACAGMTQSAWGLDSKGGVVAPIDVKREENRETASGQRWHQEGETLKEAFARLRPFPRFVPPVRMECPPPLLAIVSHSWLHVDGEAPQDSVRVDIYLPPFDWGTIF